MNFKFRYFYLAALLLVSSACGKEPVVSDAPFYQELTVEDHDLLCRSSIMLKTSLNDQMQLVWDKEDRLRIMGESNARGVSYHIKEISSDSRTAVFTTQDSPVMDEVRYALYPEAAFKSFDAASTRLTISLPITSDISVLPMVASSTGNLFEFVNLYGGLAVRPYDLQNQGLSIKSVEVLSKDGKAIGGDAIIDLETLTIVDFKGEQGGMSMDLPEAVNITSYGWTSWSDHISTIFDTCAKEFVIYIPAGDYPSGLDVILTDTEGRSYVYKTGVISIKPGRVTRLAYEHLGLKPPVSRQAKEAQDQLKFFEEDGE